MAALASLALTPLARRLALLVGAVDHPDSRKIHSEPMPMLGGVAVMGATVLTFWVIWLAWPQHPVLAINPDLVKGVGLGLLPILCLSLWDDIRPLPAWPKFLGHAVGAAIAISYGVCLAPTVHLFGQELYIGIFAIPLSMLWIMGVTSAFNLIDGLDGLSAGLALVSAGSLAVVFGITHHYDMTAAALVMTGALIGFLPYNLHPARIFLGDTGAAAIGFCLGCLALRGGSTLSSGFATAMPLFLLGLPIADTAVSMARRTIRRLDQPDGNKVYEADRNHFHHRLLARGIGHRDAVLILYGTGLLFAAVGLLSVLMNAFEAGLLLAGLLMAGLVGVTRLGYEEFAVIRDGRVLRLYDAPVLHRSFFAVFAEAAIVVVAIGVAVVLKHDSLDAANFVNHLPTMAGVLVPATIAMLWGFKLYRGTWRLAGGDEFGRLGLALVVATFVAFLVYRLMFGDQAPASLFGIYLLAELILAGGSRVSYRLLISQRDAARQGGTPVLIYGAGMTGGRLLPQLLANPVFGMRAVGFIDDDPTKAGRRVRDLPVWGGVSSLERAVSYSSVRKVIVASGKIPPERVAAARAECERLGIELLRLALTFDQISDVTTCGRLVRLRGQLPLRDEDVCPFVLEHDIPTT